MLSDHPMRLSLGLVLLLGLVVSGCSTTSKPAQVQRKEHTQFVQDRGARVNSLAQQLEKKGLSKERAMLIAQRDTPFTEIVGDSVPLNQAFSEPKANNTSSLKRWLNENEK